MNNYNGILGNSLTSGSSTTLSNSLFGTGNCTGAQCITTSSSNSTVTIAGNYGIFGNGYSSGGANTAIGYNSLFDYQAQQQDTAEFCELVLAALGHEVKYDEFKSMSKQDRKSLLRDIKISRILG